MNAYEDYPRTWKALHANGWETWVAENASGDFIVWTCPAGENATVDCIEDTLAHGQAAALLALTQHTGHRCSQGCGSWESAAHPHEDD